MRGLKLLTGLLYVLLIGATAAWVFLGWPSSDQAELRAEASAVPGALEGRTLILVSNTGDDPWTDVEIVLDEQFVFTARSLAPGEQLNLPVDDFTYTYAIPRNWNTGIWAGLSNEQQPALREDRSVSPQTIYIRAAEGKATLSLQ